MGNDVLFKTKAFGGFKKDEVMAYIDRLIAEKAELEHRLAAGASNTARLNSRMRELEAGAAQAQAAQAELLKLRAQKDSSEEELTALQAKLAAQETALNEKELLCKALTERSDAAELLQARLDAATQELETLKAQLSQMPESPATPEELEALRAENRRLLAECERVKALEAQVGAAMLDARIRSDELVKDARDKANQVTRQIYAEIGETAVKIDDLSTGISEIARSFTKAVEEVELRINSLTGNMSKTAQALLQDNGAVLGAAPVPFPDSGKAVTALAEEPSEASSSVPGYESAPEKAEASSPAKEAECPGGAKAEVYTVPEGDTIVFCGVAEAEEEVLPEAEEAPVIPEIVYPEFMDYTDGEGGEIEFL